ncbi:MAG: flotillin domain-containing protein [Xanthobacteraceae bacterium]|nr:flotillin domain-containing protein [Xanthobacteraceae bacterium]
MWFIGLIIVVALIVLVLFLNRFYIKASREVALVRTGLGGQRVVLDGGVVGLPIVHKVAEVNMRTARLEVERAGERSIITKDRLRIDATAEFYVRVEPTEEGVATAAQALGSKAFRAADLSDILEGKLVDALLSVAAQYTMDSLQDNRGKYVAEVGAALQDRLRQNGLVLEAVSLTRLDQTPFHALDQNNAFNAVGMRRLAEVIAINRRERAEIENSAEIAVRQSELDAAKRRLLIEQEEEEAQLAQQHAVETYRARTMAETSEAQALAEGRRELARIGRDAGVRAEQIERDRNIRELELQSDLSVKVARHDTEIRLAAKKAEGAVAEAAAQASLAKEAAAREAVATAREMAMAERAKALALVRAQEEAAVDTTRVESQAETLRVTAASEAEASETRARAVRTELLAKAEGEAALFAAQNVQSGSIVQMKIDLAKIEAIPQIVREMVKPAEKIESIRINQVTGFGPAGGGGGANGAAGGPVVNQVVDGILSMALQLPAVQKLGEEIGLNIGNGIARVTGTVFEPGDGGPGKPAPADRNDSSPETK